MHIDASMDVMFRILLNLFMAKLTDTSSYMGIQLELHDC